MGLESEARGSRRNRQLSPVLVRLSNRQKVSTKTSFGISFPMAHSRRREEPLLPAVANSLSKGGAQPSFRPSDKNTRTKRLTIEKKELPHSEESTICSKTERLKRASSSLERNKASLTNSLSSEPSFATSACHINSLTTLLSFLSQTVQGERNAFARCGSGLSWLPPASFHSCISRPAHSSARESSKHCEHSNTESPTTVNYPGMHPSLHIHQKLKQQCTQKKVVEGSCFYTRNERACVCGQSVLSRPSV